MESLTAVRRASANEPSDAIRVVNALLTQIDQIKVCSAASAQPSVHLQSNSYFGKTSKILKLVDLLLLVRRGQYANLSV